MSGRRVRRLTAGIVLLLLASPWAMATAVQRVIIARLPPDYPEIARRMHVEGKVEVDIIVAPDGSVTHVHALSGHPLLLAAAEVCVRNYHYLRAKTTDHGTVLVVFSLEDES